MSSWIRQEDFMINLDHVLYFCRAEVEGIQKIRFFHDNGNYIDINLTTQEARDIFFNGLADFLCEKDNMGTKGQNSQ